LCGGPYQNETGGDGIGDTPYTIGANNQDDYPLVKPHAGAHDIGITGLNMPKTVVGQGLCANMSLETLNYGEQSETFNVTTNANSIAIQTQTTILAKRTSNVAAFLWNTSGFPKGNYTLEATAEAVPGEVDTTDNNFTDGWIIVAMVGDITGPGGYPDGKIDVRDVAGMCSRYGARIEDSRYGPNWDLSGPIYGVPDGKIDARDVALVASRYGQKDP
jgi:hypothetical protein